MWFQKKYNVKEVEYILAALIRETVDRHSIRAIIDEDLRSVIGDLNVNKCFEKLNDMEEKDDPEKVKYWMDRLESLRKNKIF